MSVGSNGFWHFWAGKGSGVKSKQMDANRGSGRKERTMISGERPTTVDEPVLPTYLLTYLT